jgi:hypothetical protein
LGTALDDLRELDNVARDSFAPRLVTTPLVRALEQGSVRRIAPVFTVSAASGERIARQRTMTAR